MNRLSFQTVQVSPRFGATASLPEVIDAAAAAGFTGIGLDHWSVDAYEAAGGTLDELAGRLEEHGMRCTDVVSLGLSISDPGDAVAIAHRLAALGRRLGASVAAGGFAVVDGTAATGPAVALLAQCSSILADAGMRTGVEYLPYSPFATVERVAELCATVGWDRTGLLVDSWATCVTGQTDALTALPHGGIALVQLCDGRTAVTRPMIEESRFHRLFPGEGDLDLGPFVRTVLAAGYDGAVSTEVLSAAFRAAPVAEAAVRVHATAVACWTAGGGTLA